MKDLAPAAPDGTAIRPLNALADVTRERRRVLMRLLPVVVLACAAGSWVVANGPQVRSYDPYVFGGVGMLLVGVMGLLHWRRLSFRHAAAITIIASAGMILNRMVSLFSGAYFDDPNVSLLNSIYAYFPAFFTLLTMLLPYPRSVHCGTASWLAVAGLTTVMTLPYWGASTPREGLRPLLLLVWFGYPVFLSLVAAAARRNTLVVRLYADEAIAVDAAHRRLSALHGELEQRIEQRTAELRASNQRWQTQSARLKLVTELSGLLASARDETEARETAARYLPRIFEGTSGAVYLSAPGGDVAPIIQWGDPAAARHNRAALIANGQIIGRVCLDRRADSAGAEWAPDEALLGTVSEHLALALTNIRLSAELQTQAIRDSLTGLYNRRYLNEALPRAIAAARRSDTPLAVLVLDVDHFKHFNDTCGHESGDEVLIQVANVLARSVRKGDMVFRYGGEEFVAVLPESTTAEALGCAERMRRDISTLQLSVNGRPLPQVTLSVGVASVTPECSSMDALLSAADAALYRAKKEGRNCVGC